ncbi:hypothetical protein HY570_02130 [Candidatus Micrarchaeota archaeon]|nr:hypothetical protein [Candidatus Micrarchaeota archaeon]
MDIQYGDPVEGEKMYGTQMQMTCESGCREVDYATALSKWGKVELLKEKVKQKMDQRYGAKLDKLAELIVEVVAEKAKKGEELEDKEEKLAKGFEELYEEA